MSSNLVNSTENRSSFMYHGMDSSVIKQYYYMSLSPYRTCSASRARRHNWTPARLLPSRFFRISSTAAAHGGRIRILCNNVMQQCIARNTSICFAPLSDYYSIIASYHNIIIFIRYWKLFDSCTRAVMGDVYAAAFRKF